jgi:hypothetical protein
VIEFLLVASQTGLNIAEAFAVCELGEGHTQELIPTGKKFDLVMALVPLDTLTKIVSGQEVHQLSKNGFPEIHEPSPSSESEWRKYGIFGILNSNRL